MTVEQALNNLPAFAAWARAKGGDVGQPGGKDDPIARYVKDVTNQHIEVGLDALWRGVYWLDDIKQANTLPREMERVRGFIDGHLTIHGDELAEFIEKEGKVAA